MKAPIVHFRGEIDGASIVVETTEEPGPFGNVWRRSTFEGKAHAIENYRYASAAILDVIATWGTRANRPGMADLFVTLSEGDEEHIAAVFPDVYEGAARARRTALARTSTRGPPHEARGLARANERLQKEHES